MFDRAGIRLEEKEPTLDARYYDNEIVAAELKMAKGSRIPLPGRARFRKVENGYVIFMPADVICGNQQEDHCAFEGWALVLRAWLNGDVVLDWDAPIDPLDQHYQRFLYRVIRFAEAAEWFSIGSSSRPHLDQSVVLKPDGKPLRPKGYYLVNVPGKRQGALPPPAGRELHTLTENELELLFFSDPYELLRSVGLPKNAGLMRQIPVGLFAGKITGASRVFPGTGGKVDLGSVDPSAGVWLFELKKMRGNNKVGAISELLLYSHLIRDVQLGLFVFGKIAGESEHLMSTTENVTGMILAHQLNGALDNPRLFELLNKAFAERKEQFGFVRYYVEGSKVKCNRVY